MTKEQLERGKELQAAIKSWQSRKDAIEREADRIALTHIKGSIRGSMDLNEEEIRIIRKALVTYYNSKITLLQQEFEMI